MEQWLEKIYELLMKVFAALSKAGKKLPDRQFKDHRNRKALLTAAGEIGVKEVTGSGNNKHIVKYHAYARNDNDVSKGLADSVPWCASFVCFVLENSGMGSTNSMQARSFLRWGISSKAKPLPGDLVVFWRGSKNGWQGHVGFYLGETESFIYCLGGNQSDSVNVARYSKSKLLDIRRSSKARELSEVEEDELWDIADRLIAGKQIDTDGKVV